MVLIMRRGVCEFSYCVHFISFDISLPHEIVWCAFKNLRLLLSPSYVVYT
jgi:hypothetical protein